ncbi:MAG TPA: hypothetical protein VMT64_13940 [Candidatus Binataceae bacterium]|nr:hypothetical protein [Candidatus Binataceae bacterium]
MTLHDPRFDSFLKLADGLRELEVVIGDKARPVVAQVREELREAIANRERGDMAGTLEKIRHAMERLANLGSQLDPAEGAMMREVSRIFMQSLNIGEKGAAKEIVNTMRHKAGDPKDEDHTDW